MKLRFGTSKGQLTVEDLWDLSLENLDVLAKNLDKQVKESSDTSFIKKKSSVNETAQLAFDIVIHIINVKLKEAEDRKLLADKKAKKQQLLSLIADKENDALASKSLEELKSMVAED